MDDLKKYKRLKKYCMHRKKPARVCVCDNDDKYATVTSKGNQQAENQQHECERIDDFQCCILCDFIS